MKSDTSLHKGLRVLKLLPGHAVSGLSNQQLSAASGLSPSAITRIMTTLIEEGLAERLDNGRFAPGIQLGKLGVRAMDELDRANQRVAELRNRLSTAVHH